MNWCQRILRWVVPERFLDKQYLSYRLVNRPLLRLLLYSPWFRVGLVVFVLAVILPLVALAPVWRVSPEGVTPIVRISIVNWIQAKHLLRTGEKAFEAGRLEVADLALRSALERNPAEPEISRALLRNMESAGKARVALKMNPAIVGWLLQLSRTNLADLELAARMMIAHGDWRTAHQLLQPVAKELKGQGRAAYLKSSFYVSPIVVFRDEWARLKADEWADAELMLYRKADVQTPEELVAWEAALTESREKPELQATAERLHLAVSERLGDPDRYGPMLAELQRMGGDSLDMHARYWRLLTIKGREDEARALAIRHNVATSDSRELMGLAEAYVELRLFESAVELLRDAQINARVPDRGAVLYTDILRNAKEWERLRVSALHIRELFPRLQGYTIYLEALAEEMQGHSIRADIILQKLESASFDSFPLALATIDSLLELNRVEIARVLLNRFRERRGEDPRYWRVSCRIAIERRDSESLYGSARELRDRLENDAETVRFWGTALVAARREPVAALSTTAAALAETPRNSLQQINHALALNLNKQYRNALVTLRRTHFPSLPSNLKARYLFARLEAELGLGRIAAARGLYGSIDHSRLFSREREHLQKLYDTHLASVVPNQGPMIVRDGNEGGAEKEER